MNCYDAPEIFNTDQGCQFTSLEITQLLKDNGITISMDGKGCWHDAGRVLLRPTTQSATGGKRYP